MNNKKRKILNIIALAIFIPSIILFVVHTINDIFGQDDYDSALDIAMNQSDVTEATTEPTVEVTEETRPPQIYWIPEPIKDEDPYVAELEAIDLDALRAENEDVIGWIMIPNTKINYPIMQGEDNDFYLKHTWKKARNYMGSVFLEYRNNPDMADYNTIVYAHNMNNGTMFNNLWKFAKEDFLKKNPYVYILVDYGVLRYEVFSTYMAKLDDPTYGLSFNQEQTRVNFLQHAKEKSMVETGIEPELTDLILTLSTCTGTGHASRRVVHARLKMMQIIE